MPKKIVDVHGHIVAPSELYSYREFLIGTRGHYGRRLKGFDTHREGMSYGRNGVIPPEELQHFAEEHIAWLDRVGTDVQLVSARPYSLMHSEKPARIVHWWAQTVNDCIAVQSSFFPHRLQGIANLPIVWNEPISVVFEELERCVAELGFVGVLVDPDPSEGRAPQDVPGLGDEFWWPLYEKLVEYELPMLVHSTGCVSLRENQSLHFISEESTAVMSLAQSEVFTAFPDLKVVVPHGGGAIPYQIGRFRGTYWDGTGREGTFDDAIRRMYYDTCLYTKEALALLVEAIGADRVVLGTERPGDGSHKKTPAEGWADDIAAVLRSNPANTPADLDLMLGDTALEIYPRLRKNLEAAAGAEGVGRGDMTVDVAPGVATGEAEADELVRLVREFAVDRVAPLVRDYDAAERLPQELLAEMAELGFFGGIVPAEWGGLGLDHRTFVRIIEEVSRVDHCLGVLMSMPSALVGSGLLAFGTDEQKARWLAPLAEGRIFGGAGVTEPRSGSDVAGTQTRYRRTAAGFVLNGAKAWITNLDIASFFVTFATSDPALGRNGLSAFVVPADTPGVRTSPFRNKLGFRPLCSGELLFDEVVLPPDALLGEEGQGYAVAMTAVERGRLSVASRAVGLSQLCLDASLRYARDRVVFGQPIADFQMVQQKLSAMVVNVRAARLLTEQCAAAMERGERARQEASVAKVFASDTAQSVATDAIQIHGAYGVSEEYPVARAYRDAKVFQIVEGANDIHRVLIAKHALREASGARP